MKANKLINICNHSQLVGVDFLNARRDHCQLDQFFHCLEYWSMRDVLIRPTIWPSALLLADVQGTVLVHTISVETALKQLDELEPEDGVEVPCCTSDGCSR